MTNPLYDNLFAKHADSPEPFLFLKDGGFVSYEGFLALASQFANLLVDRGLKPADRLAAQIDKSPQALALYAACVQAGVVFLPLNTAYKSDELSYFIKDSGAVMVVCTEEHREAISRIADEVGAALETLDTDGTGSFVDKARPMPSSFDPVERQDNDLAALLYTSGTTGRSKGAMLTHANLVSNATTLAAEWRFTSSDVLIHALPIFHTHGLFVATNVTLAAGSSMIFLQKFEVDAFIASFPRASTMMGVPTFYTRLLDDPRFSKELVAHMRLFVSGSAPLLSETHAHFEERTGHKILERYGMTETNMNTSNPYAGERRPGTVGFPLPGIELKITDADTGKALPKGEVGQIEVRGPNVFSGYWKMPEKTAEELRANGFFITGDLGKIDDQGYVHIVGRSKDLIISGGYNIYPKEIELLLDEQPGVMESAVIGVPHADFGETALALLVPQENKTPDTNQLAQACAHSLARFKHPRKYIIVDELPRNAMGKVEKKQLRADYALAMQN